MGLKTKKEPWLVQMVSIRGKTERIRIETERIPARLESKSEIRK